MNGKGQILSSPPLLLLLPGVILLLLFMVIPVGWMIRVSFNQSMAGSYMRAAWVIENYIKFLGDLWYLRNVLFFSFKIAVITTFLAILFAYPPSLYIARSRGRKKQLLLTLTLSPLLIGMVCLIFGWIVLFRGHGLLNQLTIWLGITSEPVKYLYSVKGIVICLIYISIPFAILNLLDSLGRVDPSLEEAAMNVGANRWQSFWHVTFPLSTPGMFAGSLVVFALNFCAFAVPLMLGGERIPMAGLVIYTQSLEMSNIPFAAAISVILLISNLVVLYGYSALIHRFFFRRLGV
jgi:ABC-type spermidine/putrescine transport system permease subunit I